MLARLARAHAARHQRRQLRRCASAVRVSRVRTMSRAMRPAKRSSPRVAITWRISSPLARASHAETGWPRVGSMRISSGPSWPKLKPRAASSSCGEETPKSNSDAIALRAQCPARARSAASSAKSPCTRCSRGSCAKRTRPAAIAAGSRSIAMSRAFGPERRRGCARCGRRARTLHRRRGRAGRNARAASTSSTSTGVCSSNSLIPVIASRRSRATANRVAPADRWSAASFLSQESRRSNQRVSSHSSQRLPCPISIACRSRPANSRSSGGSSMRPCPSRVRSVACPTIRRCRRRDWACRARQLHQLPLDLFPVGQGVEQQALLRPGRP